MKNLGVKAKIIVFTLVCVVIVSLLGNTILYNYFRGIIVRQNNEINSLHLSTITSQIDTYVSNALDLAVQCASDKYITRAMNDSNKYNETYLSVQTKLNDYLNTYPGSPFVNKLMVFNEGGITIQATRQQHFGFSSDFEQIIQQPSFYALNPDNKSFSYQIDLVPTLGPEFAYHNSQSLGILCQAQRTSLSTKLVYIYIELNLELFQEILSPYTTTTNIFIIDKEGQPLTALPAILSNNDSIKQLSDNGLTKLQGQTYRVEQSPLSFAGLSLFLLYPALAGWNNSLVYPLFLVSLMSLLIGIVLSIIISHYISQPIQRLKKRLRRVAENDFSFDPEIESTSDELGQMGRTVNEMTLSISQLLAETKQMYETRKNIELSLLQSQVNPHFLYNTLDTIRWMAVIQKNTGIEQAVRSLINLLKNIAKGTQGKIPLREEIDLLEDYIEIQNLRYMEMFTFVNNIPEKYMHYKIVKFTLQPIIENAIFHGIEPAEKWGTINISAYEDENDLCIVVEDDGVGIAPEKLATILTHSDTSTHTGGLSGIGISNVHQRLKLVYGRAYGLSIESELGRYTKITIRLPKEE